MDDCQKYDQNVIDKCQRSSSVRLESPRNNCNLYPTDGSNRWKLFRHRFKTLTRYVKSTESNTQCDMEFLTPPVLTPFPGNTKRNRVNLLRLFKSESIQPSCDNVS